MRRSASRIAASACLRRVTSTKAPIDPRGAPLGSRSGTALPYRWTHLPVVEADLLLVVSHLDAARRALQRQSRSAATSTPFTNTLKCRVGVGSAAGLRQVLAVGRCAAAPAPSGCRAPRGSRDPARSRRRPAPRPSAPPSSSARARASASLCRSAASAARRSVTSVATLTRQGSPPKSMRALTTTSVSGRPSLVGSWISNVGALGALQGRQRRPRAASAVQMPSSTAFLPITSSREIARHLQERVVDAQEHPVGEARDRGRLRVDVEDRLEPPLRRAQRVLGLAAIVHVERRGDPAGDRRRPRLGRARPATE